jgi:hypothetical protein
MNTTASKLKLSAAQNSALLIAANNRGCVSGGRYGIPTPTLKSLQSKGLVEMLSKSVWDSEWKLTNKGYEQLS